MLGRKGSSDLLTGFVCLQLFGLWGPPVSSMAVDGSAQPPVAAEAEGLDETFDDPEINEALWVPTHAYDFAERIVDVVLGRLRLACSTLGTDDATVKIHGLRSRHPVVDLEHGSTVSFDLDWNDQANGCYLRAGIYICPEPVDDPRTVPGAIEFLYVGVPPGQTGRAWAALRSEGGQVRVLYDDGWPEKREGRELGVQRVHLVVTQTQLRIEENGEALAEVDGLDLSYGRAYLYLQQSSHSNYPLRTVFFDNVRVQ